MSKLTAAICATGLLLAAGTAAHAQTLKAVKDRGSLTCGVSQGLPGFSQNDGKGNWSGFDVDFCRAIAAAIFDDPKKVTYVPLSAGERFDALKAGKIDILSRNSTWTIGRENEGLAFAGTAEPHALSVQLGISLPALRRHLGNLRRRGVVENANRRYSLSKAKNKLAHDLLLIVLM